MSRIENSPGIFGDENPSHETGLVVCGLCKRSYGESLDEEDDTRGVPVATFAGMQIYECCFERVEKSVLSNMRRILPWYRRFLEAQRSLMMELDGDLSAIEPLQENVVSFQPPWKPMQSAPKNASWVWLKLRDGREVEAHWAHGGGEDQPIFGPGWFVSFGSMYVELKGTPYAWCESQRS